MKVFRGIWFGYPLSKGVRLLWEWGWEMRAHIVVIGPLAFGVAWRKRRDEPVSEPD